MTSTLRVLERELLDEVGKRLARFGFSVRPKGQSFHRYFKDGRVVVHLAFIEHANDFDVTVDVAIRFDAVEDLVNRSNMLLSKREKGDTFTIGTELGNLERGQPFRIPLVGAGDVVRAVDDIVTKVEAVGLPYIERYSQPEAAYCLLSRDERAVWLHSPIHAERAKRACALLKVMGRDSEIGDLGARKVAFLESVNDPGAAAFSRFLAELQSG